MKFNVEVTLGVEVELDETKFDEKFFEEYTKNFYHYDTIEDHAKYLAWLFATARVDNDEFIEGYGPAKRMGIKFTELNARQEIL